MDKLNETAFGQNQCGQASPASNEKPKAYYGDELNRPDRPATMGESAEKAAAHHRDQANKFHRAAAFFHEYPAFDEFIQLVRSGTIQF